MFKKLFKKVKDIAGDISPYSGLIASAFGLGPLYSTLIGAGVPLLAGKGGKEALAGGIGGYFGGKTFGSKAAGTYVSPMEILAGKNVNFGGTGGMQSARDIAFDRLKDAASFSNLDDKNPFKYAPGVFGALGFAGGLGAFDQEPLPEIAQFQYNPDDNPFIGVNEKYISDAQSAMQPNEDVFEFLKRIGRLPTSAFSKDGNRMKFETGRSTGAAGGMPVQETPSTDEKIKSLVYNRLFDPDRVRSREFQFKLDNDEQLMIAKQVASDLGIKSDSPMFEDIMGKVMTQSEMQSLMREEKAKPLFNRMFQNMMTGEGGISNFAQGGMPMLDGPNVVGGDVINPMGGRIMGQGAGREDLLDGKIVDPITGRTQDIMVSNNEHVIPEYSLFALGGGDTEKGQQMMDNLREKTRPMAEQMGYDFQGAEDGSMNYSPVLAQDGLDSGKLGQSGNTISDLNKQLMFIQEGIENTQRILEMTGDQKVGDKLNQLQALQRSLLGRLGLTKDDLAKMNMMMQDGKQTAMSVPSMNIQEIIQKMMAQGKSIQEIMAVMSKLNTGMPKQKRPMMAQDGMETDKFNVSGLATIMKGLEDAKQIDRMIS